MHKPRLARLKRPFTDQTVFFITACSHQRKRLFDNDRIHRAFKDFTEQAAAYKVFVGKYVLMPDHIHLFVAFSPDTMTVSTWVKSLKNSLSKTLREEGVPVPHWQKGFFDHLLRSDESYSEKWDYVARNPVRAGLVGRCDDWPYRGEIHILSVS